MEFDASLGKSGRFSEFPDLEWTRFEPWTNVFKHCVPTLGAESCAKRKGAVSLLLLFLGLNCAKIVC